MQYTALGMFSLLPSREVCVCVCVYEVMEKTIWDLLKAKVFHKFWSHWRLELAGGSRHLELMFLCQIMGALQ